MTTAFTRTKSGLANYSHFHGVDCVVYTEGVKTDDDDDKSVSRPDVEYYSAILRAAAPTKRFKVKCVGNKAAALTYAENLSRASVKNSFVIVDKDLEGIVCSTLTFDYIVTTKGYSWENELWSSDTATVVLDSLTNNNVKGREWIQDAIAAMGRRLRYLGALDAAAQVCGFAILKKTSALCGVQFSYSRHVNPVLMAQLRRFSDLYRSSTANSCPVSQAVFSAARQLPPSEVVQGHFWSNSVTRLMTHIYKSIMKDTAPSNTIFLNLALSALRKDPVQTAGGPLLNYYQQQLMRFGIQ